MSIEAPYNFIPLNKEVFYPDWDKQVSHDIPFSDGESGEIKISIKAESPIFIRNHSDDKDKPSKEFCHFINSEGATEYYIPATSMKGMVRNIVEIMSFAKIKLDEERLKEPLSVRDMTDRKNLVGTAEKAGLLFIKDNGDAYIVDYGKPRTIEAREIQKVYKSFNVRESDIFEKYKKIKPHSTINIQGYMKELKNRDGKFIGKKRDARSTKDGESAILFVNNYIGKKHHEFVLLPSDIENENYPIEKEVLQKFKNVYFSKGDTPTHKLGAFWKKYAKTKGIPVFFTEEDKSIKDIGLTQLFKLSYKKTLLEAAEQKTKKDRYDLAETIFGYVDGKNALKGRVMFSHFKSNTVTYELKQKSEILGTPNPSYYPNYIRQVDIKNGKVLSYTTLMNSKAQIAGYKHYPLQPDIVATQSSDKEKVKTHFKPLDTGTTFEGVLRFHNLKKAEIGALLSALTFHNQGEKYMHNIGMAKSLGYGKIGITLRPFKGLKHTIDQYLESFEELMDSWENSNYKKWNDSLQIGELFSIHNSEKAKKLQYQLLENPEPKYELHKKKAEANDFTGAKKAREYLIPHSLGSQTPVKKIKKPIKQDKEVTLQEIAISLNTTVEKLLSFITDRNLPYPKNLTSKSILKEAQVNGLINQYKTYAIINTK